jgi:hypothetical protein
MGIFSWFATTTTKSLVAVVVQDALEPLARGGILDSQPATLANRMVEAAYTRVPNLANAKYNKHVFALSVLAMVPALPSFSVNERECSKHALGILLKHVLELQMSNSLALTLSEQNILERAQKTFIAAMEPPPLGSSFSVDVPPTAGGVFSKQEEATLNALCDAMNRRSGLPAFFEIVPLTATTSTVGIGSTLKSGERIPFGSLVKSIENHSTTVTLRGFNGRELPDAPQTFPSVDAALSFSHDYFVFMSTRA